MTTKTGGAAFPSVVFIHDSCSIAENSDEIIITENNGKEHKFPKGSFILSQRNLVDNWDLSDVGCAMTEERNRIINEMEKT